jgi:hypothetical protein
MAPVPDWACLEAGNFLILHSTKVKPESIREIAGRLQVLLKVLAADYPMDGLEGTLFVVRICKDESQYGQYGGPGNTTGYWDSINREVVSYVDEADRKGSLRRIPGILVHAYFAEALGFVAPHEWFSLGLSSFYSACEVDRAGNLVPKKHLDFERTAGKAKEGGTFVPLEQFLRYGYSQFMGPKIVDNYAQAWSFAWFLKMQKDPEWKGILSSYYGALSSGARHRPARVMSQGGLMFLSSEAVEEGIRKSAWEAVFGAFDGEKWKRLERAWLDFK